MAYESGVRSSLFTSTVIVGLFLKSLCISFSCKMGKVTRCLFKASSYRSEDDLSESPHRTIKNLKSKV